MMGCAKIFPNAVASLQKIPRRGRGVLFRSLIDKNDSEEQRQARDRVSSLPNHKHGPEEASISDPAPRSF